MKNVNMIFLKLIVFFLIIAALCFGLYYFMNMPVMFYFCNGSIIISAVFFIAWLFRLFFKKDIDRSLNNSNSVKWDCPYCGVENPAEAKFCTNCGKEHIQEVNNNVN